jgi:hypothetical protein
MNSPLVCFVSVIQVENHLGLFFSQLLLQSIEPLLSGGEFLSQVQILFTKPPGDLERSWELRKGLVKLGSRVDQGLGCCLLLVDLGDEVYFGADSLAPGRRARLPVDLSFDRASSEPDAEAGMDEILRRNAY